MRSFTGVFDQCLTHSTWHFHRKSFTMIVSIALAIYFKPRYVNFWTSPFLKSWCFFMSFTVICFYHETLFMSQLNGIIASRPMFTYTGKVLLSSYPIYSSFVSRRIRLLSKLRVISSLPCSTMIFYIIIYYGLPLDWICHPS